MASNAINSNQRNGPPPVLDTPTRPSLPHGYPTILQKYTSCRWRLGYMLTLGFVVFQSMQNSMSFAVVCMTKPTIFLQSKTGNNSIDVVNASIEDFKNTSYTGTVLKAEFDYSSETQGLLISSVFYAGFISPILSSFASRRFGPKRVILLGILIGSVANMLLPVTVRTSVYLAILCRIIIGLTASCVFPVSFDFWLHWAPDDEKAQLVSYSLTGSNIANIVTFAVSGYICLIPIDKGWPFIFYVFGLCGMLWCVAWQLLAYDTPDCHPSITEEEKTYIKSTRSNIGDALKNKKIPWKNIALTRGVWSFCAIAFLHSWNVSVLFSYLPSYMDTVLKFDVEQNGLLSSLPFITRVLGAVILGLVSVKLLKVLSVTNTRKLIQCGGHFVAAGLSVALCFLEEGQEYIAVAIFTISTPFQVVTLNSAFVTPLDMVPQYASIITSVGVAFDMVGLMASPVAISYIITERTRTQWSYVFYMNAGIYAFAAIFFSYLWEWRASTMGSSSYR